MKTVEKMFMLAVCVVFVFGGMSMASLVADYHFDEVLSTTRTLANEVSGNWGDATASAGVSNTGAPYLVESFWFFGAGAYVDTHNQLSATGDWTIAGWSRTRADIATGYRNYLMAQFALGTSGRMYLLGGDTADGLDGEARFRIQGDGYDVDLVSTVSLKGASMQDDTYHFIAATREGDTFSLYVDGVLQDSATVSGVSLCSTNLTIGNRNPAQTDNAFGYCDEITIYDNALSEQDIAAAYIPEPASMVILGLGSLVVFGTRRRV